MLKFVKCILFKIADTSKTYFIVSFLDIGFSRFVNARKYMANIKYYSGIIKTELYIASALIVFFQYQYLFNICHAIYILSAFSMDCVICCENNSSVYAIVCKNTFIHKYSIWWLKLETFLIHNISYYEFFVMLKISQRKWMIKSKRWHDILFVKMKMIYC